MLSRVDEGVRDLGSDDGDIGPDTIGETDGTRRQQLSRGQHHHLLRGETGQHRPREVVADLVHAQFTSLALGVAARGALGSEMILPVADGDIIECRRALRVGGADECVECEGGGTIAVRESLHERLQAR